MPVRVITGNPRNGKTLLFMSELLAAAKDGKRPVFHAGVDGIQPGYGTHLPDVTQWNAKNPDGSHVVPDGSIIFVDEAWKWFGHLHNAGRQATPPHVLDMAEHGHRGLDFVFTTQMPAQIYPFLRGMMQEHTHVVRRYGMQMADLYTWQELNEDVKSASMREGSSHKLWPYPKNLFDTYKSASEHTVKRKIPFKVLLLPLLLVGIVGLIAYSYHILAPKHAAAATASSGQAPGSPGAAPASDAAPTAPKWASVKTDQQRQAELLAYAQAHQPRIASMPWTAPVFDDREVVADPHVYCMASKAGQTADGFAPGGCKCTTEQGTIYEIDADQCMAMALHGEHYNPYKRATEVGGGRSPKEAPAGQQSRRPVAAVSDAPRPIDLDPDRPVMGGMPAYGGR